MTQDDEWTDWIEHDGGKCPVPDDKEVMVRWRGGQEHIYNGLPNFYWKNLVSHPNLDITHYKRRKSAVDAETTFTSALSEQIGGDHYSKLGAYQPVEVLKRWLTPEEFRGYMKGTAIVYLARERDKNGDEDIGKADHTLRLWEELK